MDNDELKELGEAIRIRREKLAAQYVDSTFKSTHPKRGETLAHGITPAWASI